jgi:hypothetical protein
VAFLLFLVLVFIGILLLVISDPASQATTDARLSAVPVLSGIPSCSSPLCSLEFSSC